MVTEDELRDWINERVGAKYQRVHKVVFMEDFSRGAAGKTLKRVMRNNSGPHETCGSEHLFVKS